MVTEGTVEVPANNVAKPSVPLDAMEDNGVPARKKIPEQPATFD